MVKVKALTGISTLLLQIGLALLCLLPSIALAEISASVERASINEGDTFVLHVRQTDQTGQRPDFAPLEYDFEIVRRSQSSQTRIINFKSEHWLEWSLVLAPRRTGTLVIPSIRAGRESTRPITVEVKQGGGAAQGGNRDVFLDVEVDQQSAWVQSQVLLTVRVFHKGRLDGNLTDPEVDDAVIEPLADQRKYETIHQGVRYKVIERRFAVFPQRSGTLQIPPVTLSGSIDTGSSRFGFNPFGPTQGKTVHIRSRLIEIEVLPQPADWPAGETWLPAAELTLTEEWSPDTYRLETGEAVTRTLRLRAEGLAASQLPQPEVHWPGSLKTYPETPERKDLQGFDGVTGTATFSTAIIPTRDGTVTAPEIRMTWWNTRLKRRQVAVIPARRFEVAAGRTPLPASPEREKAPMQASPPQVREPDQLETAQHTPETPATAWGWIMLSLFLLLGWVATAILWARQRQMGTTTANGAPPLAATPDNPTARKALQSLRKACRDNQPGPARTALLAWMRSHYSLPSSARLEQILPRIQEPGLRNAALELDDFLYRNPESGGRSWNGAILLEAAERESRISGKENSQNRKDLPSLYSV